jgi:hypothetical protein
LNPAIEDEGEELLLLLELLLPVSFDVGNQNKTKKPFVISDEQRNFLNEYYKDTTRIMTHLTKLTQRQLFNKLKKK